MLTASFIGTSSPGPLERFGYGRRKRGMRRRRRERKMGEEKGRQREGRGAEGGGRMRGKIQLGCLSLWGGEHQRVGSPGHRKI